MFSRFLKAAAMLGGGLLAFGGGAVGTHFAYPLLEKNLFPKRINDENRLSETLDDTNTRIEKLKQEINSQGKLNLIQSKTISDLNKQEADLKVTILEKEEEIIEKDKDISNKQNQILDKERENNLQKEQIGTLRTKYSEKEGELKTVNEQKKQVQDSLDYTQSRLSLTRQNILTPKGLEFNPLDIKTKPIILKSFSGDKAKFETNNDKGEKKEFEIKYSSDKFPNHEQKAKELRKTGISFRLHDSFNSWDKTIEVVSYDADYFFKATQEGHKKSFVFESTKTTFEFKMTDYVQSEYLEDAFRVLIALGQINGFPICHVINSPSGALVEFCDKSNIGLDFSENNVMNLNEFSATETGKNKVSFWTNTFKTYRDFINFWIDRTVDFIRTGKTDLSDSLNPLLLSKNYKNVS